MNIQSMMIILIAYLIGSLSSAVIVCRLWRLPDPRTQGSNNPGATNVLRIGGKTPALITLLGDFLKGAIPVLLATYFTHTPWVIAATAVAAFMGHLFPIFFQFQGGKGVATFLGCLIALSPLAGMGWIATWLLMAYFFRYSSLAALTASVLAPLFIGYFTGSYAYIACIAIMSCVLIYRHRGNITRLLQKTEPKIGQK